MKPRRIKRFGWRPDLPDKRDLKFARHAEPFHIPPSVDLRPEDSPVYDQLDVGSCTGNSTAGLMQFVRRKEGLSPDFVPARLMIYYDARVIEGDPDQDAGAQLRDCLSTLAKQGVCDETLWPYSDDMSVVTGKPSDAAYAAALTDLAIEYSSLDVSLDQARQCLAAGYPFVLGFTVSTSFMNIDASGMMPMPAPGEEVEGGHAVCCVGYDDARGVLIVRNSWGPGWGDQGYFYGPYAFFSDGDNTSDWWTIRKTSA